MLSDVLLRWDDAISPSRSAGNEVVRWLGSRTPSARSVFLATHPLHGSPAPTRTAPISIVSTPAISVLSSLPVRKKTFDGCIATVAATDSANDRGHCSNTVNFLSKQWYALLNALGTVAPWKLRRISARLTLGL